MLERDVIVGGKFGLHARVAMRIADVASGHEGTGVEIARDDKVVFADSVMGLMSMAAGPGTILKVRAIGSKSHELVEMISEILTDPDEN